MDFAIMASGRTVNRMTQSDREMLSYMQGGLEMLRAFFDQNEKYQEVNDELCCYYNFIRDLLAKEDGDPDD